MKLTMLIIRVEYCGMELPESGKSEQEYGNGLVSRSLLADEKPSMRAKKDENLRLANNLRHIQSQGTSLSSLAKKAGDISTSTISAWAQGQVPTDHSALLRLSKALNCTLEQLLFGDLSIKQEAVPTNIAELFSGRFVLDVKVRKVPPGE